MSKGSKKRPRDTNKLAKRIVDIATGEVDESKDENIARFQRAGRAGGKARAKNLSQEERSGIAKKAAKARWEKGE